MENENEKKEVLRRIYNLGNGIFNKVKEKKPHLIEEGNPVESSELLTIKTGNLTVYIDHDKSEKNKNNKDLFSDNNTLCIIIEQVFEELNGLRNVDVFFSMNYDVIAFHYNNFGIRIYNTSIKTYELIANDLEVYLNRLEELDDNKPKRKIRKRPVKYDETN